MFFSRSVLVATLDSVCDFRSLLRLLFVIDNVLNTVHLWIEEGESYFMHAQTEFVKIILVIDESICYIFCAVWPLIILNLEFMPRAGSETGGDGTTKQVTE